MALQVIPFPSAPQSNLVQPLEESKLSGSHMHTMHIFAMSWFSAHFGGLFPSLKTVAPTRVLGLGWLKKISTPQTDLEDI